MHHHKYSRYFPFFFLLADLACLNAGILVANFHRFETLFISDHHKILQLFLNGIWLLVFFGSRLQEINRNSNLLDHFNRVLTGLVVNLSIVFALWFALQPVDYSRKFLFVTYLVFTLSILTWRGIWHYTIRYYRAKGYNIQNVVIIGAGDLTHSMVGYLNENPKLGYHLVGILDNVDKDANGTIENLESFAMEKKASIIFCYLPVLSEGRVKEIIDFADNHLIKVNLISQFSHLSSFNLSIEQFGNIPIISVNTIPLDHSVNRLVKRTFDVVFSSLVLIAIFSWMAPLVGLLINLESKGPVYFKQKRHGKGNKGFLCWKFRTMICKENAGFEQARKNDPRITKVGAILRKTSMDELPQFINVFLGDMSVVGPRPHPIQLNEEFHYRIDRFWQRHAVKPGITGLAQAKGFRGETVAFSEMSGRIKLDRFYVKNWSLILDFKIILLTIISILRGNEKAY